MFKWRTLLNCLGELPGQAFRASRCLALPFFKKPGFQTSSLLKPLLAIKLYWVLPTTCLVVSMAFGRDNASKSSVDETNLTLDQLVNIQVTSVSKKETPLNQSPAAISVITQDDIRRSGLNSIPELLRLVPGMDVAQINASEWAVSARGFNGQYSDKLLVLIDGRSVYNPVFAGVRWDVQDLVLEDLERIEVIRGPGATLWGANAVNGVVNIITKSAKETQGALVSTSFGTQEQPSTSVRYGGQLASNLYYRVYAKYVNQDGFVDSTGHETRDDWNTMRAGLRLDWEATEGDRLTLQGDYYRGEFGQMTELPILTTPFATNFTAINDNKGGNVLSRWTHTFSDTSELTLQAYYDHTSGTDADYTGIVDTYDVDLQHRFDLGNRQTIVWGTSYRYSRICDSPSSFINWTEATSRDELFTAFAQDDITIVEDRLHLTLGSKFEHNDDTGFEIEPSARLLWTPKENQTVWVAVSRAVRTPSDLERDSIYNVSAFQTAPGNPPTLVQVSGSSSFHSEGLLAYELGYRIEPTRKLSLDVTAFYNVYNSLNKIDPAGAPSFVASPTPHIVVPETFDNGLYGQTYGTEISVQWSPMDDWKLSGSYSLLEMHLRPDSSAQADSPRHQVQLHSYVNLPHDLELNTSAYFVSQINPSSSSIRLPVSSYVRLDLGLTWHPCRSVEIGIWGQNLLSDHHPETASSRTTFQTEIPRSVVGKFAWRF